MNQTEVLSKVASGELTPEAAAKLMAAKDVHFKVSEKGAISIYGLRRFPVTLYRQELETVLDMSEKLRTFIADNSRRLVSK